MTSAQPTLSDSVLQRALAELAGDPDSRYLVEDVLRIADVTPQQGRLAWPFELSSRMAIVMAVALLLIGLMASLAVYGQLRRQPLPLPPRLSSIVVQKWNGLQTPDDATSQTVFGPSEALGVALTASIPANAMGLRWSPDGTHLVYFTRQERPSSPRFHGLDKLGVFVADADGANPAPVDVTHSLDDYDSNGFWAGAVWAPSSDRFALTWDTHSCTGGPDCMPATGIDVFDPSGARVAAFETPSSLGQAIWSPDGSAIGWLSGSCPGGRCSSDAFHWRPVTDDHEVTTLRLDPDVGVTWLGDNRLGVVAIDSTETTVGGVSHTNLQLRRVFSMAPDGTDERDIQWPADSGIPAWSPDGRSLFRLDPQSGLLTVRDVLTGVDSKVAIPVNLGFAGWSPEGDRFVLYGEAAAVGGAYSFYVVNADGSGFQPLGDGEDFGWMPPAAP